MTAETLPDSSHPLDNARWERFVVAYVGHGNATRAYIEAGYSKRGAEQSAHRLLRNADVQARVHNLRQSKLKALHMSADECLAEIAKVARFSLGSILHTTPDGDPYIDLSKASEDDLAALSEATIEDFTDGREVDAEGNTIVRNVRRVKAKAHSKIGALTLVAKAHGLLTEKVEHSLADGFVEAMMRGQQRVKKGKTDDKE